MDPIMIAYLIIGLLFARYVRGKLEPQQVGGTRRIHGRYCNVRLDNGRKCDNGGAMNTPCRDESTDGELIISHILIILLSPAFWPLFFLGAFLFAERIVPKMPRRLSKQERLTAAVAESPQLQAIMSELEQKYPLTMR